MSNELLFDGEGIYVPEVGEAVTLWRRDKTGNPWVGVEVPSVDNARTFANVFVLGDGELVDYFTAYAEGEAGR